MTLYRARYLWPDGRCSWVSFASFPADALRWASDFVRCFTGGELLSITEQHPLRVQLNLVGMK